MEVACTSAARSLPAKQGRFARCLPAPKGLTFPPAPSESHQKVSPLRQHPVSALSWCSLGQEQQWCLHSLCHSTILSHSPQVLQLPSDRSDLALPPLPTAHSAHLRLLHRIICGRVGHRHRPRIRQEHHATLPGGGRARDCAAAAAAACRPQVGQLSQPQPLRMVCAFIQLSTHRWCLYVCCFGAGYTCLWSLTHFFGPVCLCVYLCLRICARPCACAIEQEDTCVQRHGLKLQTCTSMCNALWCSAWSICAHARMRTVVHNITMCTNRGMQTHTHMPEHHTWLQPDRSTPVASFTVRTQVAIRAAGSCAG